MWTAALKGGMPCLPGPLGKVLSRPSRNGGLGVTEHLGSGGLQARQAEWDSP